VLFTKRRKCGQHGPFHHQTSTYECRKFGRKFMTYQQLWYADRKSENLIDN